MVCSYDHLRPKQPVPPSVAAKRAMSTKRKDLTTADANVPADAPVAKKAKGPHRTVASLGEPQTTCTKIPKSTGHRTVASLGAPKAVFPKILKRNAHKTMAAGIPKKAAAKTFKYSNAQSLEKELPKLCCICWPADSDDQDEDEEDEPPKQTAKDKGQEPSPEVTAKGYPITQAGLDKFIYINEEQEKRDPDSHNMYIYNDFAGYGTTEVLENLLADFHKDLFKEDISPLKKWAYIEGLVTWLKIGDLYSLMGNENSEHIKEIFVVFIPMLATSLEMIAEHNLFSSEKPVIQNQGVMSLLLLEFLKDTANDFDMEGLCEIVRAADKFGVNLEVKPEWNMKVTQEEVAELREACEDEPSGLKAWKTLYPSFKRNHPGGRKYDISKMSKVERKQHEF